MPGIHNVRANRIISLNFDHSYRRFKQSRYRPCSTIKAPIDVGRIRFTTLYPLFSHRTDFGHRNKLPINRYEFPSLCYFDSAGDNCHCTKRRERMACGIYRGHCVPVKATYLWIIFSIAVVPNFNRNRGF